MITKCLKKKRRCCESGEKVASDDDMITKYFNKTTSCCESAEKVGSNDDLITEILLYVPASSLLCFKSVSKHWLSLITSPQFTRLHIRRCPLRPSGLFIPIDEMLKHPQYRYIPLNSISEQPPSCNIIIPTRSGRRGLRILQSCNGLLFCSSITYALSKYYVYNPTTGNLTTIPVPQWILTAKYSLSHSTALAFDPLRSPHYNLVYAHWLRSEEYQMVVYSSETQLWKVCGDQPFNSPCITNFWNGVYLNGAVYYLSFGHTSICFKIDEQLLETMQLPHITDNNRYIYLGEAGGRLHLITANDNRDNAAGAVLDVYVMEKDCSKWCVRYQVELGEVYEIEIMGIVGGEREEDSFLVFKIQVDGFERFMKYKFADKTLEMLFEMGGRGAGRPITALGIISNLCYWSKAFQFIESLSPV